MHCSNNNSVYKRRETDRQTDRQTDRDTQTDRRRERERERLSTQLLIIPIMERRSFDVKWTHIW